MPTDPRTGFQVRNSMNADELAAAQAAQRAQLADAAQSARFGNVNQGVREPVHEPITAANLNDFTYFQAHKAEILAAYARQELPGQANYAAGPIE